MKKIKFFALLFFLSFNLYSQTNDTTKRISFDKNLCLLTGVSYSNHISMDLGIAVNNSGAVGFHPISTTYFFGSEIHLIDNPIVAPKIGVWASGGASAFAVGINMIYYSDFSQSSLVFRPEIGIGIDRFKITYGYNARLTNTNFDRIPRNIVGFTYCFKLKKMRTKVSHHVNITHP